MRGGFAPLAVCLFLGAGCVSYTPLERRAFDTQYEDASFETSDVYLFDGRKDPVLVPWIAVRTREVRTSVLAADRESSTTLTANNGSVDYFLSDPARFPQEVLGNETVLIRQQLFDSKGAFREIDVKWVRVPKEVHYTLRRRSPLTHLSYPLWGLPLDLLDVPITGMRQLGFMGATGPWQQRPASGIWVLP